MVPSCRLSSATTGSELATRSISSLSGETPIMASVVLRKVASSADRAAAVRSSTGAAATCVATTGATAASVAVASVAAAAGAAGATSL
eukprot:6057103-Prymnesium_polylepis.1